MVAPIFESIRVSTISFRPGGVDETSLSASSRGFTVPLDSNLASVGSDARDPLYNDGKDMEVNG